VAITRTVALLLAGTVAITLAGAVALLLPAAVARAVAVFMATFVAVILVDEATACPVALVVVRVMAAARRAGSGSRTSAVAFAVVISAVTAAIAVTVGFTFPRPAVSVHLALRFAAIRTRRLAFSVAQSSQRATKQPVRARFPVPARSSLGLARTLRLPRRLSLLPEEGIVVAVNLADDAGQEALVGLWRVGVRSDVS
jgi:hypothetical protein